MEMQVLPDARAGGLSQIQPHINAVRMQGFCQNFNAKLQDRRSPPYVYMEQQVNVRYYTEIYS